MGFHDSVTVCCISAYAGILTYLGIYLATLFITYCTYLLFTVYFLLIARHQSEVSQVLRLSQLLTTLLLF